MHLEDLFPFLKLRKVNVDLTVETTGPKQRLVKDVGPVGGRKDYHSGIRVESVHLGKQLVQSVLALVIG